MAVQFPFGSASTVALSATGDQAVTITNMMTIINGVTTEATGNRTINLTVNAGVKAGAMILIKTKTNGTETTIFGTGMIGTTYAGVAGKTKTTICIYDGTNFIEAATPVQID